MSGNRTRGLLRAAALLAVGTSPLLASAASAAEAPTDIVDGKFGNAPEIGLDATKPATDLLSGQAVKLPAPLPAPLPGSAPDIRAPQVAAPAAIEAPAAPSLPAVGDALAPQARTLPAAPALPGVQPPAVGPEAPALPDLGALPAQAPTLG
ncbi:hypothetical protein ALI22I_32180 [Saccharothrix sp. ALI-22-I]|uniref:hypothetical protein n=1 Tax=Saccharothrix sp. ALI-22-I TaxID=1933778 RepID=UPI00097C4D2D|nr:hypothetical protein [Saccharothrix sp. ALI-22-I]ONI85088.1 hypothetical protein ALI22I_32180 [Saccharothrix sp. ALI-22-I]